MAVNFDISRKIIASMTTDSWQNVPHFITIYEADAGKLLDALREYNSAHDKSGRISLNSAMLKVIIEGIKACPAINGHISYDHRFVSGRVTLLDHIDISMPIVYGDGRMMTVTLPHTEDKSMREIQAMVNDFRERIGNTDMDAVMYGAGLADSLSVLGHGRILKTAGRLIGAKLGPCRVRVPLSRVRKSISDSKTGRSLSPDEIRQGSITVSSLGPLYRNWKGHCAMLQVIPPQICAMAIGTLQKKAVVTENDEIAVGRMIPVTIANDHRTTDFSDIVPFMERMDEILGSGELIRSFI